MYFVFDRHGGGGGRGCARFYLALIYFICKRNWEKFLFRKISALHGKKIIVEITLQNTHFKLCLAVYLPCLLVAIKTSICDIYTFGVLETRNWLLLVTETKDFKFLVSTCIPWGKRRVIHSSNYYSSILNHTAAAYLHTEHLRNRFFFESFFFWHGVL